ncbi:MAG TPA: hydantoinase/oxoprolinase family protein, partial [Candidatus Baltobacteraceae bacterium]|nr:hydantoinase/oxoprolinase family protein [Candidatus Baltobacteraceae bacterium]
MLRVGIDVGGTFTDVVAIDARARMIVRRIKVPTTHDAPDGVAAGIVRGLEALLASPGISPDRISFIAHSTTQATNALLEGDLARVGLLGLVRGIGALTRAQVAISPYPVRFARVDDPEAVAAAVDALVSAGAEAIAASAAFGVDQPAPEIAAVAYARGRGVFATAGHEVSTLYGLRSRTRTAALNAAILPRMVRTSEVTARATRRAGIDAPLMIMRSDGGVMNVEEVARRPILTMLSGPAAGIAGALLHEHVTDGIFIEVGGTSSDLSVIRRGLPQLRPARIGRYRTLLRTLDVRTIAVAGGSLVRIDPHGSGLAAVRDVGPRSAHIAGFRYAAFTPRHALDGARVTFSAPQSGDPADYVSLELRDGTRVAPTPTCAANLLGLVPESAFARGDAQSARIAFELVGGRLGVDAGSLAQAVLKRAGRTMRATIEELMHDYALDARSVELVGGGGAAAALVPFVAGELGIEHRIARDAEVISPVGVALALVREVVERTIPAPSPEDIVRVRREAVERVVAGGADPALVDVAIELDAQRSLVRATAQ